MVIAVEPIIEIKEENLHIRIEDTILITDDGPVVLSAHVPKEVDEILALVIVLATVGVMMARSFVPALEPLNKSAIILVSTVLFFLLRLSGQGVLTLCSRNMVMKWFNRRRGIASGITGIMVFAAATPGCTNPAWSRGFRLFLR